MENRQDDIRQKERINILMNIVRHTAQSYGFCVFDLLNTCSNIVVAGARTLKPEEAEELITLLANRIREEQGKGIPKEDEEQEQTVVVSRETSRSNPNA